MKYILASMLVVLLASPVQLQSKNNSSSRVERTVRELTEMERELSEALVHCDVATLQRVWSDDFVFTAPNGHITNKTQRIAGVKTASKSTVAQVGFSTNDDVRVHLFNNTAVVTVLSTWKGKIDNKDFSEPYQSTHVWIKQQGRWQLVAAHVSHLDKK